MPSFGTLKADTLTHSTAGSLDTNYVVNGSSKAWGNIDGTGTPSLRESLNVSSLDDNGTGTYDFNYTSSLSGANLQSAAGIARRSGVARGCLVGINSQGDELSASSIGWSVYDDGGVMTDVSNATVTVHGDLA